jgi:hypothetical protein
MAGRGVDRVKERQPEIGGWRQPDMGRRPRGPTAEVGNIPSILRRRLIYKEIVVPKTDEKTGDVEVIIDDQDTE